MNDPTNEELLELLELLRGDRKEPSPSIAETLWPEENNEPPDMVYNLPGGSFQ